MPWEAKITRRDNFPLGKVQAVQDAIHNGVPAVQFYREPSGIEKLVKSGLEFPAVLIRHMEKTPASIQGDYDDGEVFLRLYLGSEPEVGQVDVEVRGNGNPLPVIAAICLPNNWIALDLSNGGEPFNLTGDAAAGWERFKAYHSKAIHDIRELEKDSKDA